MSISRIKSQLQDEEYQKAIQRLGEAKRLADKEREVGESIDDIRDRLAKNIDPDSIFTDNNPINGIEQRLNQARQSVSREEFDEASRICREAEQDLVKVLSDLHDWATQLEQRADGLRSKADTQHTESDYERAIENRRKALKSYQRTLDVLREIDREAVGLSAEEYDCRIDELREKIPETRQQVADSRSRYQAQNAQRAVETGDELLENNNIDKAIERYEDAREYYERALELAKDHDLDHTNQLQRGINDVEERLVAAQFKREVYEANRLVEQGDLEQAIGEFESILDGLDEQDEEIPNYVEVLRQTARTGHLDAQLEQGYRKHEQAVQRYQERDYYEAREAFEAAREFLKPVLSLASRYGLTEKKQEILRLDRLCEVNASEAREALYGTGTEATALTPMSEIKVPDTPPPTGDTQSASSVSLDSRREAYQTQDYEFDIESLGGEGESSNIGRSIPPHERIGLIGEGGNARVWHVRMEEADDDAALKIPKWQGTLSKAVVKQFLREAETWSRIDDHDNIVTVYDWGFAARPWLLMEFIEGEDLRPHVGSLSLDRALEVLGQVADALQHARGVDHLDIKPENILLDDNGTPKLADWGLARVAFQHEHTNTRMGISPPYAAPEQVDRTIGPRDHRTDIYQLGVLSYELLTGQLPFDPEAPESLEQRILNEQPRHPASLTPGLPETLNDIVLRAIAKGRDQRYEAAIQFRDAIMDVRRSIERA